MIAADQVGNFLAVCVCVCVCVCARARVYADLRCYQVGNFVAQNSGGGNGAGGAGNSGAVDSGVSTAPVSSILGGSTSLQPKG